MSQREQSIIVSGGLFTSHFVNMMCDSPAPTSIPRLKSRDFMCAGNPDTEFSETQFTNYLKQSWDELLLKWNTYWNSLNSMELSDARRLWIMPLLRCLGFEPVFIKNHTVITEDIQYPFSHIGWHREPGASVPPLVHVVSPNIGLDERVEARRIRSNHSAVQMYLNESEDRWALLTNGHVIRILRDFHHTTVSGYLEFNLDEIFYFRRFSDFVALVRFCHASRFVRDDEGNCVLDTYFDLSKITGETVGKGLQKNVRRAIEELGNGFLAENPDLLDKLKKDTSLCKDFYADLLKVIYRIIFMLYAEQRGLLDTNSCEGLFLSEYSITSLRNRIMDRGERDDSYTDLWDGLCVTFSMMRNGVADLGVPAFNGMLFEDSERCLIRELRCKNTGVIRAIKYLTTTMMKERERDVVQSISYGDISVEEIGGIYEGLLEFTPMVTSGPVTINKEPYPGNSFILNPLGMERKETGSYYTNPGLIEALVESALNPVVERKLSSAGENSTDREKALLSLKVCDPACGSGAFLIAATNHLGMELAKIRTGSALPSDADVRNACRDVLVHCIYGVDINPMSVELTKVSLWINALVKGKPLNFLDSHIQCGNSLVGATPELLEEGIPDSAFERSEKEEKAGSKAFKARNKAERTNMSLDAFGIVREDPIAGCVSKFAALSAQAEDSVSEVHQKERAYRKMMSSYAYCEEKFICDLWCSAFFWDVTEKGDGPTQGVFSSVYHDGKSAHISAAMRQKVEDLSKKFQFFHWHLAFPDVFAEGGFDCILGNPPWEKIKIQEKEFFSWRCSEIANAANAAERRKMIKSLKQMNPDLYQEFLSAVHGAEGQSRYLRTSGRYPLTGTGDINTYTVFSELARNLVSDSGRCGIIVPSGIATDATTAKFFADLVEKRVLVSLFDFENRKKLFPIHSSYKFCLLTMTGSNVTTDEFQLAFFLQDVDEIHDESKVFTLSPEDIKLINPNTKNCPIFRSSRDAEITKSVYRRVPILWKEEGDVNPWGISFQAMFHMANDSGLFATRATLLEKGFKLEGNVFVKGEEKWLPLYEAKMVWQYDHRFGDFCTVTERSNTNLPTTGVDAYLNPHYSPFTWYWVNAEEQSKIFGSTIRRKEWLLGFRDVTNSTNARTMVSCIIPSVGVNHKMPLIFTDMSTLQEIQLCSTLNSIVLDYLVREKIGGTSMGYFILKQLPLFPPDLYPNGFLSHLVSKVIELTYTAWDLEGFAQDILKEIGEEAWNTWFPNNPVHGGKVDPFIWDEERRFTLQRELDAIYARLYGINKDDLVYILDTFPIVRKNDETKYGYFRTKEDVLMWYDHYANIKPYQKST